MCQFGMVWLQKNRFFTVLHISIKALRKFFIYNLYDPGTAKQFKFHKSIPAKCLHHCFWKFDWIIGPSDIIRGKIFWNRISKVFLLHPYLFNFIILLLILMNTHLVFSWLQKVFDVIKIWWIFTVSRNAYISVNYVFWENKQI